MTLAIKLNVSAALDENEREKLKIEKPSAVDNYCTPVKISRSAINH